MRRLALLCLLPALLLSAAPAIGAGSRVEDIPVDSWIYDALFELSAHTPLPELLLHTRPLARGEVADALARLNGEREALTPGAAIVYNRLRQEFAEELAAADPIRGEHRLRLGGGPTARADQFRHGLAENRIGVDLIPAFTVAEAIAVRLRIRFDSDARSDSQFHGKHWKDNFSAWVEQSVLTARWKRLTVAFGREYWRWGPSPHDAMLMSDHSPPFNGLRLQYRAGNWSYAFHATPLDQMFVFASDYAEGSFTEGLADRYLVAHRLNWKPWPNLEVAASEVMVFGGFDRRFEWNYLNPFLPYYWEQLNESANDNPLWNLELSWRARPGLRLYGEWLIDDFQIDFESEPQQIGVLIGGLWSPAPLRGRLSLNAEYQRINTYVYGQGQPWNRYFHHRDNDGAVIGIGSNLGTDADRISIQPLCHLSPRLDLRGDFHYIRRGANRISDPQKSGVPKGTPFPSGTVEREWRLAIGPRWQQGGHLVAWALVGYDDIDNVGHVDGARRSGWFVQLRVNALWWKTFGV